jgi:hypothetical protein
MRGLVLCAYMGSAVLWGACAIPQTESSVSTHDSQKSYTGPVWATAANRWRLVPSDVISEGDTVSPAVRAARNAYLLPRLSRTWGSGTPIVEYQFSHPDVSPPTAAELGMVWVVGTFNGYHVYSADGTDNLLYTEVDFGIDTIIKQPPTSSLGAGSTIDINLIGGKVTANGVVHTFHLSPAKYSLEPNHRYILALYSEPNGIFIVHKQWDVTDGTVQPSSIIDDEHIRKSESQVVGLPVSGAINYIRNALSSR